MNVWIVVTVVVVVECIVLAVFAMQEKSREKARDAQNAEVEELRREMLAIRGEDIRHRREIAALHRILEEEQTRNDALLDELEDMEKSLRSAQAAAEQAEARRIRSEKDIYASRMRADLLEKEIRQLNQALSNQEKLYQDILRERDNQIARLQESQPAKRRPRKRPDVLDQQVSLEDLLGGM